MMAAHRIAVAPLIWGSPWSMRPRTSLMYCCSVAMPKSVKRHTNTTVQISYYSVNEKCFHCKIGKTNVVQTSFKQDIFSTSEYETHMSKCK